jgi:xylulokinase
LTGATIEVHNTTGAVGAALASAVSVGLAKNLSSAIGRQEVEVTIRPGDNGVSLAAAYEGWVSSLAGMME